jgi:hypothetical protein
VAKTSGSILGGGLLHVNMFAHNTSGIAYRDRNRWSETVESQKGTPPAAEAATKLSQLSTTIANTHC